MINEKLRTLKDITEEDLYKMINSEGNNEIKDWLAKLGSERIDEIFDPSISIERAIDYWRMQGYSEKEITKKIENLLENK